MTRQAIAPTELHDEREPRDLGGLMGLIEGREVPFPLREVKVRASIAGDCCRVVVEQRFANPHATPLEAVHIFPLPEDGAVIDMELRAGETVVRAECRERREAEKAYGEARESGLRAALLTRERADVHTVRVANIPAGEEIGVRMVIVERLESVDGRLVWRFPTVVAPRYVPGKAAGHTGDGVAPDTDAVPDASRITPPLRLAGGTRLDLEASIQGSVAALESSLHAVRVDLDGVVRVAPSGEAACNKDFVLSFSRGGPQGGLAAYTDGEFTVAVFEPPPVAESGEVNRDAVFLVDVSGSMQGVKLDAAKVALKAALHALSPGDRFAILAFHSVVERFGDGLLDFGADALRRADAWIGGLHAHGGTEMLEPLTEALAGTTPEGRVRTVLLITDGQSGDDLRLVRAAANRPARTHVFTAGIDTAVNGALLKRLARIGGGTCELMTPRDDVQARIARLESRFGTAVFPEVAVDGEAARPGARSAFAGRAVSFVIRGSPRKVAVTGQRAGREERMEASPARVDFPLGPIWARERIAWLEDQLDTPGAIGEADAKREILEAALTWRIASRYTAFVAVEASRTVDGTPITLVQPVELAEAWSEAFLGGGPAMAYMAPSLAHGLRRKARAAAPSATRYMRSFRGTDDAAEAEMSAAFACTDAFLLSPEAPSVDPGAEIALRQDADGGFGRDVRRTAAAMLALIVLGHTRLRGVRRRTVTKAAKWLEAHAGHAEAVLALALLERVEQGGGSPSKDEVVDLLAAGDEGEWLKRALESLSRSP